MNKINNQKGFTLAEVLITLAVIGVVAAITIPTLINTLNTKAMDRKEQIFNHRLTNGLREMAVKSTLIGYDNTYDFAKELSNHYKMFGIYNSDNIISAYPVEKVIINNEGKTLKVSAIKKVENLKLENNETHEWSAPVAIIATDGTPFIFSYNKKCTLSESDINEGMQKDSTSGLITACIAGIYDKNGIKAPNKQDVDIISFNGARLGNDCIRANGMCVSYIGTNYQPIDCSSKGINKPDYKYCIGAYKSSNDVPDYWAGARKVCDELGMRLPTISESQEIYRNKVTYKIYSTDNFWTSEEASDYTHSFRVDYSNGIPNWYRRYNNLSVACIE